MALASISDTPDASSMKITEQVYAAQGKELSLLGVNWTYAPVGDVNSDRRNPVIGVRSFGDGKLHRSSCITSLLTLIKRN